MTDADVQVGSLDYRDENFVELVVGYLEGGLADSQRERLKAFLAEDAGNRDAFVTLCFQASLLTTCADIGAAEDESPRQSRGRQGRPLPVRAAGFLGNTWNGTVRYFSQGGPLVSLMYLVTILLFGFGLLAGSLLLVRPNTELTERSGPPPAMVPVGVITRMSDCRWADPRSNASCGSVVALGAKFDLWRACWKSPTTTGKRSPSAVEPPMKWIPPTADSSRWETWLLGRIRGPTSESGGRKRPKAVRSRKWARIRLPPRRIYKHPFSLLCSRFAHRQSLSPIEVRCSV